MCTHHAGQARTLTHARTITDLPKLTLACDPACDPGSCVATRITSSRVFGKERARFLCRNKDHIVRGVGKEESRGGKEKKLRRVYVQPLWCVLAGACLRAMQPPAFPKAF